MVKRKANCPDSDPAQKSFARPSEREHLFQVSDVFTFEDEMSEKLNLNPDTVSVECEVVGGEEAGRTILIRLSLDANWKGFFMTRLFLKAINQPYRGEIEIDTDEFQGRQFYATVKHEGTYANIDKFNFDKIVETGIETKGWDDAL